jgi:predicted porin
MMNSGSMACACAALIWAGSALAADEEASPKKATSAVTVYGLIDEGVEYLNHNASHQGGSLLEVGAGVNTSYFGFRGAEDLGGGLSLIWNLEGGVWPDTGTSLQGGRLFGRQSWVGLEGSFGRLTFGRQYTMKAFATSPINMFGTGAQGITTLDNGVANPRADNALSYRINLTRELEVGLNYSTGRDAVATTPLSAAASNCPGEGADSAQCKEKSALIKYTTSSWGLTSAYERNGGGNAATFGGLTNPDRADSRLVVGGYGQTGNLKVAVGWIRRVNQGIATPKSHLYWVMTTLRTAGNLTLDGVVSQLKYDASPNRAFVLGARGAYALSRRTFLYVTAEHIRNEGTLAISASTLAPVSTPVAGGSQTAVITGVQHTF